MERDATFGLNAPRRADIVGIAGAAVILAVIAVVLLVSSQFRAVRAVDEAARTHEQALVTNGLRITAESKLTCLAGQTLWDDAVAHLDRRYDPTWATANIGKFVSVNCGLPQIIVFGAGQTVLGAWRDGSAVASASLRRTPDMDRLIDRIRQRERRRGPFKVTYQSDHTFSNPIDESVFSLGPNGPEFLHASLVQPDFRTVLPKGPEGPIVLARQPIDAKFLRTFGEQYLLRRPSIHISDLGPPKSGEARADLKDDQGHVIGALEWLYDRSVETLVWTVGPALGLLLLVIICAPIALIVRERRHSAVLSRAMNEAQAASEAKTQFIANMSHEIRTPMNGVLGILALLRSKPLDPDTSHLVEHAYSSGTLLLGILNDVLDSAHVESGRIELRRSPCDVARLVHDIEHLTEAFAAEKGLSLSCEVDSDLGVLLIDEGRLKQVLMNLISNAVKFTVHGGVTLCITSIPTSDSLRRRLRISVRDTGIGVAPEDQSTIFRRFVQLDGSVARRQGGAGLGLAISQSLVQLMGGEIHCDSQVGKGSHFWFEIECEILTGEASASAMEPEHEEDGTSASNTCPVRILLVEDNPTNRLVACRILEAAGAVVETAINGLEGLQAATVGAFDLILMDIQMPEMDGVTATRKIRALDGERGGVPIIGLTANVLPSQTQIYRTAGMNDVVAKPIDPSILIDRVHAALS